MVSDKPLLIKRETMSTEYFKQDSIAKRFASKRVKALDDQFGEEDNRFDAGESAVEPANTVDQHSNMDANVDVDRNTIRAGEDEEIKKGDTVSLLGDEPEGKRFKWKEKTHLTPGKIYKVEGTLGAGYPTDLVSVIGDDGNLVSQRKDRFKKVSAQAKFPLRYRGHMIRVKSDPAGGHKAAVYHKNELKHVTKRHGDPEHAAHAAKVFVDDNTPPREEKEREGEGKKNNPFAICTESVGRSDKKKYNRCVNDIKSEHREAQQAFLQNPTDPTIAQADPELEALRAQAQELQAKITDIQSKAEAYINALADKQGANGQGMMGLQGEAARIQKEMTDALLKIESNFVRFSDQTTYAKMQTARLADPAWSQLINEARTRGRGVMKRVSQILDRVSILFQKLTTNVAIKEYPPGSFTEKEQSKILKNNDKNINKINQFQQDQLDVGNRAQKYFLDSATGRIGVPGT